ncbi:MAG: RNA polymerase sigma factor [Planctomycetes bacterium]|nr:RNA polymerase sigma factor [Planctomycetota bacterium]
MAHANDYVRLVKEAQFGDRECLDRLAELATVRLRAHVYRLTLREDVTQDIVQESVLEMINILGKLKRADLFWPWLYGIALNKLKRHRRTESRHKRAYSRQIGFGGADEDKQEALQKLLGEELRQIIAAAMEGIKPRHRAVLSMRCYDNMSYAEIAAAMECSEFGAQMLFYRAKKSLARQLSRNGLSKGALLTALVVFGKMTAANEAAAARIAVSVATVKVSTGAAAAATAAGRTALAALATAGAVTVGTIAVNSNLGRANVDKSADSAVISHIPSSRAANECLYFFPQGASGPVMLRQMRTHTTGGKSFCDILQNEYGNYHYDAAGDKVHINNYRKYCADMSVSRLPTDKPDLTGFLDQAHGGGVHKGTAEYISSRRKGLFVIASQDQGFVTGISRVDRHENMLEEEYFQFAWPETTRIVDDRDTMHKRGWTWFRIEGRLGSERISGRGRIPFVYRTCDRHSPWLELNVGRRRYVDTTGAACVVGAEGAAAYYPGGTFMKGLARPWMGLHTIDTVRRDAADARIGFETLPGDNKGKVNVVLLHDKARIVYTVDMHRDVIDEIEISCGDVRGRLKFSYLQELEGVSDTFVPPRISTDAMEKSPTFWLFELLDI